MSWVRVPSHALLTVGSEQSRSTQWCPWTMIQMH